jgi:hypothetical protein
MPRNWPALKGRDDPLEAAEAMFGGDQRLVISPLQGLLPENDGASVATQAVEGVNKSASLSS